MTFQQGAQRKRDRLLEDQVDQMADLVASDGLPDEKYERLETLRFLAQSSRWVPTNCPECAIPLDVVDVRAHAESHWPADLAARDMSVEATAREAALLRAGGHTPRARG